METIENKLSKLLPSQVWMGSHRGARDPGETVIKSKLKCERVAWLCLCTFPQCNWILEGEWVGPWLDVWIRGDWQAEEEYQKCVTRDWIPDRNGSQLCDRQADGQTREQAKAQVILWGQHPDPDAEPKPNPNPKRNPHWDERRILQNLTKISL